MEVAKILRFLAASLMIVVAVISFALAIIVAISASAYGTEAIGNLILFGVLYLIIGIGLFAGKILKLFYALSIIVPLIGAILGTLGYIAKHEISNIPLLVIDIVVVLLCGYLLIKKQPRPKSP